MPKFRKRATVIEAVQVLPHRPLPEGVHHWPDEAGLQPRDMSVGYIDTPEGRMHVQAHDWIINGIAGEKYSCKPEVFEAIYEPVSERA